MLRRTQTFLKVSPYFLYLKELSQAGKLKGAKASGKRVAKQYRNLSPAEKAALIKRAQATTFPASLAYRRLAKQELARKDLTMNQRYATLKRKWAAKKKSQKKVAPAGKLKSAKSKVKMAGKAAKKAGKKARK
jgi:hypothetical protein